MLHISTSLIFSGQNKEFWRLWVTFFSGLQIQTEWVTTPSLGALRMEGRGPTSIYSRVWEASMIPVLSFCNGSSIMEQKQQENAFHLNNWQSFEIWGVFFCLFCFVFLGSYRTGMRVSTFSWKWYPWKLMYLAS